jgi:mRNA interferase HigB
MRTISIRTLRDFWTHFPDSEQPLKSWTQEIKHANWPNAAELKRQFGNASIINAKRVVFNIKGNDYRLVVDIDYRLRIIFIVWIGTHVEYDKIDVKTVRYVKTNKK